MTRTELALRLGAIAIPVVVLLAAFGGAVPEAMGLFVLLAVPTGGAWLAGAMLQKARVRDGMVIAGTVAAGLLLLPLGVVAALLLVCRLGGDCL